MRTAGIPEALQFGLRPGPVPHSGEEGHGEPKQLRRGALLRQRLSAGREGALWISEVFENADPGDPSAHSVGSVLEAADACFEPQKTFLLPAFGGERARIGPGAVFVAFGEAGTDPVGEKGPLRIPFLPEEIGQIMPGAGGRSLAFDELEKKGLGPTAGVGRKPQEVGVFVNITVGRIDPVLPRFDTRQPSGLDNVLQGLPQQRRVSQRPAREHESETHDGRLGEFPEEFLQSAKRLSDLTILERLRRLQIPRPGMRRESLEQVDDNLPRCGGAVKPAPLGLLFGGFHDDRFGRQQRVEFRRLVLLHHGHALDADRAETRIEGGEEIFAAPKQPRIVRQEGFGAFIDSDDGNGVTAFFVLPADDEGDPVADETLGDLRRREEEADVVSSRPQPIGGGPFIGAAEGELRGHFICGNAHPSGRHRRRDARRNAGGVFLNRPPEGKPDPHPSAVPGQVRKHLLMERRMDLGEPAFHAGMVVGELRDIEVGAGDHFARFPVGERHEVRQPFGQPARPVQGPPPFIALQRFRKGTQIPAGGENDLIRLAGFRFRERPDGGFFNPAQIAKRHSEAVNRIGSARVGLESALGRSKGVGPEIRQGVNNGFHIKDPADVAGQRVRHPEAIVGAIEIPKDRPTEGEFRIPGCAQIGIFAADVGTREKVPYIVENADSQGIEVMGEIPDPGIGGLPLEGFPEKPAGEALAPKPARQPRSEDQGVHRKPTDVGLAVPVFGGQRVEVQIAMAVVDRLETLERIRESVTGTVVQCHEGYVLLIRPFSGKGYGPEDRSRRERSCQACVKRRQTVRRPTPGPRTSVK